MTNEAKSTVTEVNANDGSFIRNLSGGNYSLSFPFCLASDGQHIWIAGQDHQRR